MRLLWLFLIFAPSSATLAQVNNSAILTQARSAGEACVGFACWTVFTDYEVDPDEVDADLTDFPIRFALTGLGVDFWDNVAANGADIRVVNTSEDTQYPHCIAYFVDNGSTGVGEVYAEVDLTNAGTDAFRILVGNGSATDDQDCPDSWSAWLAVYHLNEDVNTSTDGYADQTGSFPLTGVSMALTAGTAAPTDGQEAVFDGGADYLARPGDDDALDITGDLCIWSVVYHDNSAGGDAIAAKDSPWTILVSGIDEARITHTGTGGGDALNTASGVVTLDTWLSLGFTRTAVGTTREIWVNGVTSVGPTSYTQTPLANTTAVDVSNIAASNAWWEGSIDEVWIRGTPCTDAEMAALHSNTFTHGTFFSSITTTTR